MAENSPQRVVVLGGGIGGQVAATRLKQKLGSAARVILIERSTTFTFAPSLLWLMVGKRQPKTITRDYSGLSRRGVELVHETVTGIDTSASEVQTESGVVGYDHLVVALGAVLDPGSIPGLTEHTHHPYDLPSAERLRDALHRFTGGRVTVAIASLPYKCPAAPYETAMLIDGYLRQRGIRDVSQIAMYTPEPLPLPVAGPQAGYSVAAELAARGITFHPRTPLEGVEPTALRFGGELVPHDLAVVIPPHRPPDVIAKSSLAGPNGWIPVDRATLRTRASNVYAIGDSTVIPLENGLALPKAGVFAHGEAEVVAENVARRIRGDLREEAFDGHGTCFLETGGGKSGLARGDFFASPVPKVAMHRPGRSWHAAKIAFEQYWLRRWL
ncbi:FAD/NAD(P)-binding oxidoreductase [Candidatus Amarobacter glycogenicus]|uniref:NAD(P)/FAD-dependent oxidoreductase n=1 Tax=Candidatus Amarobacter glycogenicus TaxID=3140699 RepID=UPI002A0EF262|nr:NAD(P)/FAD-dependent oxidoreductase [Dehalococcoidia bacterium]